MRRFIRHHKTLTATLALAVGLAGTIGWLESGSIRGRFVAHLDLARGHYVVLGVGLAASWRPDYIRLLRERYGIEERVVAGCVVTQPLLDYVEAYNKVSMNAANREFGRDIFQETLTEASRNWAFAHPR